MTSSIQCLSWKVRKANLQYTLKSAMILHNIQFYSLNSASDLQKQTKANTNKQTNKKNVQISMQQTLFQRIVKLGVQNAEIPTLSQNVKCTYKIKHTQRVHFDSR